MTSAVALQAVSGQGKDEQQAGRQGAQGDAAAAEAVSGGQQAASASTLADGMKPAASAQCDEVRYHQLACWPGRGGADMQACVGADSWSSCDRLPCKHLR